MAKETPAEAAARFRKIAEDKSLPETVRNTYLDKANAAEKEAAKPTMAKGGSVAKKMMAKGGVVKPPMAKAPIKPLPMPAMGVKPAMAKGGAVKAKTKMAAGGMAKKGCK